MARFRVKELARERGLTSEELAQRSGLKISTVRNVWQNRVEDPNYSTLSALATALGVTIEALVDESESAEKKGAPGLMSATYAGAVLTS